ncbi:MAG: ATP-binding protein [Candidatus Methanofastidiosia archaeon]|jgi:hypothetical protein
MEYIVLAVERDKSHLLKKAKLKISEWLSSKAGKSFIVVTVYLEFSDLGNPKELEYVYLVVSKNDFKYIKLPKPQEIDEENRSLKGAELSKKINLKKRYIKPISVSSIEYKETADNVLIKINLKKFEIDNNNENRFQFRFRFLDSFKKLPKFLSYFQQNIEWNYEMSIRPYHLSAVEFSNLDQIKTDLELWIMIQRSMYQSISNLYIRNTQPFKRMVVLPKKIAEKYKKQYVHPETLCINWFFPEFSEFGVGAEIIINKRESKKEREKKYVEKIISNPKNLFSTANEILNGSRISLDFEFICSELQRSEFENMKSKKSDFIKFFKILFEITYNRDNEALSKLEDFLEILKNLQELKYGSYYFHLYRLLNQMMNYKEIRDIITPNIKSWTEEFINEPKHMNKTIINIFRDLKDLIYLIEQFYYYNIPEEKYEQKKRILMKIQEIRDIAEHKLINPESYLIAEEVLVRWERSVQEEFEHFVGSPELNVELATKNLLASEHIHLIFDITNISDVPLTHLIAKLLPSEQYEIFEHERRGTTKRKRLTKSDDRNERIFSPEFVMFPRNNIQNVQIELEVSALTEEEKKFSKVYVSEINLFHDDIEFKKLESNPYIVGNPVKTREMFVGRDDIFEKIRGVIVGKSVNQTIVYGNYRIGKTSLLYQLLNKLKGKYVPVLAITHGLETGDPELLSFWSEQISNAVKDRRVNIPEIPDYEKLSNPYNEFREFLDEAMEKLGEAKIIFMIDEYDMIDELIQSKEISTDLFRLLDWMIKHDRIELIIAGRPPLYTLKTEKWKEIAAPFAQIKLGSLNRVAAMKLIKEPVRGYIEYDDSAMERILRLTNCHPYLIQLCCSVLVNYHNLNGKSVLTYSDVEKCIPEILGTGKLGLEAMILHDSTPEEQIVLRIMAVVSAEQISISEQELVVRIRGYNPYIEDIDIRKAISRLENKEVIRAVTEEYKNFKFVCELYRYWVYMKMEPLRKRL